MHRRGISPPTGPRARGGAALTARYPRAPASMTVNRSSMMPPAAGPILFVDDEAELVQAVGSMLRTEFGEGRVKATSVPQRALDWVKQEKPAVLITDVRMPNMSGLELIEKTQAVWGPVPTVVITAYPSEGVTQATRTGSMVYLPKPFSFRSLLDTIRQLEARRPASFRGAISVATLADLLQLYAISGSTGLMVVKSGTNRGEIWFDRGQVVHASSGEVIGFDAFCTILSWPEGSFSWKTKRAETQSIEMSVSELLLEAYRINDEAAAGGAKPTSERPPSFAPAAPSEPQPILLGGDTEPAVASSLMR
ncbi:MAG: response regulator [Myxococcales bacterium]|nr:MAG: response regulator [Myxococcales bacterium]